MKENDKIFVAEYLKDLNERKSCVSNYSKTIANLTCKELSARCGVTQASISNLTTNSKFYLLDKIASVIFDYYAPYFFYEEHLARIENPDNIIYPRDKYYVLMCLTDFYTSENFKHLI